MAITGSGTSTAPYVVHDYWELKTACCNEDYRGMTDGVRYVRLDNDINCNDRAYGDTFEWETINLGRGWNDGSVVDLDLNNKTIKNVMIKNSNSLFCGVRYNLHSKIHDGKILNIFSNNAAHIVNSDSTSSVINCEFENVSWSVNGTTVTGTAFDKCNFNKSSLYYESSKINDHIIYTYTSECSHSNSDFKFDVKDRASQKKAFHNAYSKTTVDVDNCRISGDFHNIYMEFALLGNCVVDVSINCESGGYYPFRSYCSGVVNKSKFTGDGASSVSFGDMITVTTNELKNAATLSGKGFNVVNIGG